MARQKDLPTLTSSGGAYGFFRSLPREVRDNIYGRLYRETIGSFKELGVRITLPVVGLRLINQQFKLEYDERCATNEPVSHFVLNDDTYSRAKTLSPKRWQALTARTTNMDADLNMCFCRYGCICSVDDRLAETAWRIEQIVEGMPRLRKLRIHFAVAHRRCLIAALQCAKRYRNLPKLVELAFAAGDDEYRETLWTWTEQDGMVQNRQSIDQLS